MSMIGTLDRFRGCLLGGAVGDALGAPVEFMSREQILGRYGAEGIADYPTEQGGIGHVTDDTQLTLFTAEGLLIGWRQGCASGQACLVAATRRAYLRWLHTQEHQPDAADTLAQPADEGWLLGHPALYQRRGPGQTCLDALAGLRSHGRDPSNDRKGCGGVMRAAPAGLFFWRPERAFSLRPAFMLAARLAGITHGHPTGQLPAGVLAVLVLALVEGYELRAALQLAKSILMEQPDHHETLLAIEKAEVLADSSVPSELAIDALGAGWIAEEALAIALYCALVAESFAAGVQLAVNHDGDSDSTGAIAGNLLGAMHGASAIPSGWLERLELREVVSDVAERLAGYWTGTETAGH